MVESQELESCQFFYFRVGPKLQTFLSHKTLETNKVSRENVGSVEVLSLGEKQIYSLVRQVTGIASELQVQETGKRGGKREKKI